MEATTGARPDRSKSCKTKSPESRPLKSLARHADIIGNATDHAGLVWDVRERRPSEHCFDVLIGWPHGEPRGQGGRGVAVILSAELARDLLARG